MPGSTTRAANWGEGGEAHGNGIGSAYGIRTRVTGVRGQRPRPLDERAAGSGTIAQAPNGWQYGAAFSISLPACHGGAEGDLSRRSRRQSRKPDVRARWVTHRPARPHRNRKRARKRKRKRGAANPSPQIQDPSPYPGLSYSPSSRRRRAMKSSPVRAAMRASRSATAGSISTNSAGSWSERRIFTSRPALRRPGRTRAHGRRRHAPAPVLCAPVAARSRPQSLTRGR